MEQYEDEVSKCYALFYVMPTSQCFDGQKNYYLKKRKKKEKKTSVTTWPQVLITSNPASQHTCFTPSPNSSAARPLRSGSPRQRPGWPLRCPAKSMKETRSVKSPTWARQPVQTTLRRLKTNVEDSPSHIKIHAAGRNQQLGPKTWLRLS